MRLEGPEAETEFEPPPFIITLEDTCDMGSQRMKEAIRRWGKATQASPDEMVAQHMARLQRGIEELRGAPEMSVVTVLTDQPIRKGLIIGRETAAPGPPGRP